MKEKLKSIGSVALGLAVFAALLAIPVLFISGSLWLSEKVLPFLLAACGFAFLVCLFVLVPLAVFNPTRSFAGTGLFISSYLYGVTAWFMGLLLTFTLWGGWAVAIGLFFLGVGVVPIALLATLLKGLWSPLLSLLLLLAATYGSRFMATYVLERQAEQV